MADDPKKTYIAWLNDAHAMELGLVTVLEKQAKETENKPLIQSRIQEHLEQTKRHAKLIEACVKRNGETVSVTKDFASKITATMQSLGVSFMEDALVKNIHSSYAAEHFEIATYTLLEAAAEEMDDDDTASVCGTILKDEIDMANWLLEQLPQAVQEQLAKE